MKKHDVLMRKTPEGALPVWGWTSDDPVGKFYRGRLWSNDLRNVCCWVLATSQDGEPRAAWAKKPEEREEQNVRERGVVAHFCIRAMLLPVFIVWLVVDTLGLWFFPTWKGLDCMWMMRLWRRRREKVGGGRTAALQQVEVADQTESLSKRA